VDAVVVVGSRGYVFSLVSGQETTGDLERFRELIASVRFDEGRELFVSDQYGYSLAIPADWQARPASAPWVGGTGDDLTLDTFPSAAGSPTARFTVAAHAIDEGTTEAAWIETFVPRVTQLFGRSCRFGSLHVLYPDADASWRTATIDGRDGLIRAVCGRVDGVVFSDGYGYWMRLTSSEPRTGADVGTFDLFADTIDLDAVTPSLVTPHEAESSAPTRLFTSKRFGYTIRYPAGWTAASAPRRKQGEALEAGRTADEFTAPAGDPRTFTLTSRTLGGDVVDETWLGTFVPNPRSIRGSACLQADGTPTSVDRYAAANVAWSETVVGGRPARMRAVCGHVQAVLTVGERAYVLWLATKARSPGGDTYAFRQIADTFRIAP
jgi:hypothetical protein